MKELTSTSTPKKGPSVPAIPSVERRMFLRALGLTTVSAAAFMTACQNSINDMSPAANSGARVGADGAVSFGMGNIAILNYAYALEQLETAFYYTVVEKGTFKNDPTTEKIFKDIHDHELVHREFFKVALGGNAIGELEFDVSSIDFKNQREVLNIARVLEDTGVAAYNGVGPYIQLGSTPESKAAALLYLNLAGKIVSVEARHASLISSILQPNGGLFAGDYVVNNMGLEASLTIMEVLGRAGKYIKTKIDPSSLISLTM
ncbi:ferritin-like domain-containing protein [Larkinella rosea]|nr:ferritin-like domain-containing protein [Larkinella rosea]